METYLCTVYINKCPFVQSRKPGESRPFHLGSPRPARLWCDANPADTSTVRSRLIYPGHVYALPYLRVGRTLTVIYSSFLFVAVPSSLPSLKPDVPSIDCTSPYDHPNLLRPIRGVDVPRQAALTSSRLPSFPPRPKRSFCRGRPLFFSSQTAYVMAMFEVFYVILVSAAVSGQRGSRRIAVWVTGTGTLLWFRAGPEWCLDRRFLESPEYEVQMQHTRGVQPQ
jgi:hypothetical protein